MALQRQPSPSFCDTSLTEELSRKRDLYLLKIVIQQVPAKLDRGYALAKGALPGQLSLVFILL